MFIKIWTAVMEWMLGAQLFEKLDTLLKFPLKGMIANDLLWRLVILTGSICEGRSFVTIHGVHF